MPWSPTVPGELARLLTEIGDGGANVIAVEHLRDGLVTGVRETHVALTLATRGAAHADALVAELRRQGREVDLD